MKSIIYIASLFLAMTVIGAAQGTTDLTVELYGLKSDKGQLMVALYKDEGTWLKNNYKGEVSEIVDGKATVIFKDVPHGEYAISSFHDENSNDKLDTGWFGIPKEPYACSRGAKGKFGPPKWEDAVFKVENATQLAAVKF